MPLRSTTTRRVRYIILLIVSAVLVAEAAVNFFAYWKQADSVEHLNRQGLTEILRFWETGEGEDPQIRWQSRFLEIFKTTKDPVEREIAGLAALSMLSNMEEWEAENAVPYCAYTLVTRHSRKK